MNELLRRVQRIGDELHTHKEKLVFSYVDIAIYRKVQNNLKKENINYIEWTPELMDKFAEGISEINRNWGLELGTYSEKIK